MNDDKEGGVNGEIFWSETILFMLGMHIAAVTGY